MDGDRTSGAGLRPGVVEREVGAEDPSVLQSRLHAVEAQEGSRLVRASVVRSDLEHGVGSEVLVVGMLHVRSGRGVEGFDRGVDPYREGSPGSAQPLLVQRHHQFLPAALLDEPVRDARGHFPFGGSVRRGFLHPPWWHPGALDSGRVGEHDTARAVVGGAQALQAEREPPFGGGIPVLEDDRLLDRGTTRDQFDVRALADFAIKDRAARGLALDGTGPVHGIRDGASPVDSQGDQRVRVGRRGEHYG